jgi:hypothetical protein
MSEDKKIIEIPNDTTNDEVLKLVFYEHDYNVLKDRMMYTLWWKNPYKGTDIQQVSN